MNDRALPQTPDIDSSYDGGPGTPMFESGASTPLLSAGGPGSLPNVPSQSLQVAHDTQRSAITRRLQSWNYLKSVHQGDQLHWFNTIRISKAELEAYYQPALNGAHPPFGTLGQVPSSTTAKAFTPLALQKRATRFMVLGLSLGPLLDIANPHDFLKALLLTSQEYDQISDENLLKPKMVSDAAISGFSECEGAFLDRNRFFAQRRKAIGQDQELQAVQYKRTMRVTTRMI